MIASTRGLLVLVAIAASLALGLVVISPRPHAVIDRQLWPGFHEANVTELAFTRTGEPDVRLGLTANAWRWLGDEPALADPTTLDAAFAALRGAQWHRRAPATAAGTLRGELRISLGKQVVRIGIGSDVIGAAQTWVVHDNHALLVDQWVARALLPERIALRVRNPLAEAASAAGIWWRELELHGAKMTAPFTMWIEPARADALTRALAALEIVALDGRHPGAKKERTVRMDYQLQTIEVARAGTCDGDRVLITATSGGGCVERAAWELVERELDGLAATAPAQLIDRRPLPITASQIKFDDSNVLELAGRPRLGNDDADPARVAALLAALTTPAPATAPIPAAPPKSTLVITAHDGTRVSLAIYDGLVARSDEPFALVPAPELFAVIARPPSALRDPVLWREDVTTLSSLTLDRVTYKRGAVIGEWTREPAGTLDGALVDALVSTLASVRAPAAPPPVAIAHTLGVTFTPPAGAPSTHTLELGPPGTDGCAARVDRAPVRLDLPLCTAAIALATAR